jgi:hypothetical protein
MQHPSDTYNISGGFLFSVFSHFHRTRHGAKPVDAERRYRKYGIVHWRIHPSGVDLSKGRMGLWGYGLTLHTIGPNMKFKLLNIVIDNIGNVFLLLINYDSYTVWLIFMTNINGILTQPETNKKSATARLQIRTSVIELIFRKNAKEITIIPFPYNMLNITGNRWVTGHVIEHLVPIRPKMQINI